MVCNLMENIIKDIQIKVKDIWLVVTVRVRLKGIKFWKAMLKRRKKV